MTLHSKKTNAILAALFAALVVATIPQSRAQLFDQPAILPGEMEDPEEGVFELVGGIEGDQYVSATGFYRITIPILPELDGQIDDTLNLVTFQDAYGTHMTIGCFPMNDVMRAEETKRGRRDFLVWFFQNHIQMDFTRNVPGTSAEPNARFIKNPQSGDILFTQLLLPGGSAFNRRVFLFPPKPPAVAKRGNFIFINNGNIYVISIELAERIFEHSTYNKTVTEEEDLLRRRLGEILNRMTFMQGPASVGSAPAAATKTEPPAITFPGAAAQ